MNINEDFNLDAYEKAEKEQSLYPVDESCREIESVIRDRVCY